MMNKFLGLGWNEAIEEIKKQGRTYEIDQEPTTELCGCIKVSTKYDGAYLIFDEDNKVECYEFIGQHY